MTDLANKYLNKLFRDLEGSFTAIPPSTRWASADTKNPIGKAHYAMIRELCRMHIPSIPVHPEGDDFDDVADYLTRVAHIVDLFVKDVGAEVKSNALSTVDLSQFENVMLNSLEGYALHEVGSAAEAAREEAENPYDDPDRRYDEWRDDRNAE